MESIWNSGVWGSSTSALWTSGVSSGYSCLFPKSTGMHWRLSDISVVHVCESVCVCSATEVYSKKNSTGSVLRTGLFPIL